MTEEEVFVLTDCTLNDVVAKFSDDSYRPRPQRRPKGDSCPW
jgi:hypothetical protein